MGVTERVECFHSMSNVLDQPSVPHMLSIVAHSCHPSTQGVCMGGGGEFKTNKDYMRPGFKKAPPFNSNIDQKF